jgi:hypothetical protein
LRSIFAIVHFISTGLFFRTSEGYEETLCAVADCDPSHIPVGAQTPAAQTPTPGGYIVNTIPKYKGRSPALTAEAARLRLIPFSKNAEARSDFPEAR